MFSRVSRRLFDQSLRTFVIEPDLGGIDEAKRMSTFPLTTPGTLYHKRARIVQYEERRLEYFSVKWN